MSDAPVLRADEGKRIDDLALRLEASFPALGEGFVRDVVDDVYHQFDGVEVREVVPLLVERVATSELIRRTGQRPVDGGRPRKLDATA